MNMGKLKRILSTILILSLLFTLKVTARAQARDYVTLDCTSFRDHSITTLHIGSNVDEITPTALRGLKNLRCITVSEDNVFYSSYSGCLYDKLQTELICYPPALSTAYIPNSVTSISKNALSGVPEKLKNEIRAAVENNATGNYMEWDIPGEHFVHMNGSVQWMNENGDVVSPTSAAMILAAAAVNVSSTASMTQSQQLQAAFDYLSKAVVYERSNETPSGDWLNEYATRTMSTNKGNCYGYAAAFGYIAKGLGYEARVCTGTVTSSLGGRTPHAWTEVKIGKKWYVFDAEMQRAKGGGYYKQTYESYPAGPLIKETSQVVSF